MIDLMLEDIKGNSSVESITKKPKQVVAVQCPCVALYCHFQKSKKSLLTCCSLPFPMVARTRCSSICNIIISQVFNNNILKIILLISNLFSTTIVLHITLSN